MGGGVRRAFIALVRRELRLALRQASDTATVLVFFVLTVSIFPFGVGPEPAMLARISAGVIWVTALLAALLSLDRLFQADYEDGSLEQIALAPLPLEAAVLAKCLAHWLTTGLPLIVAAPVMGALLNMPPEGFGVLVAAMALGTPVLTFLGAVGSALTVGARRAGVLVPLLLLPLYVPVLIFGVAAVDAALLGMPSARFLVVLAGLFVAAATLTPWATAAALRQALS